MTTLDASAQCLECDIFESQYESATFALAKAHNALDIAAGARDPQALRRLTLEAYEVADRQRNARSVLANHRVDAHGQRRTAVGMFPAEPTQLPEARR